MSGQPDPPIPIVIKAQLKAIDISNQKVTSDTQLTVYPCSYYIGKLISI